MSCGPYNGENRRVTPEEWRKLSAIERRWSHTDPEFSVEDMGSGLSRIVDVRSTR